VVYEELVRNKKLQIKNIAKVLDIKVRPEEIHEKIENLPIPEESFDPLTQLHPNHITDGRPRSYKNTLSKNMIEQINIVFKNWLFRNGYF
jgi:hypothetical protein